MQKNPGYAFAHYSLGSSYQKLGEYEKAIVSYREALKIDPHDSSTRSKLGSAYKKLGRNEEAIARMESFNKARSLQLTVLSI